MPSSPAGREHRFNLVHPRFGDDSISLLRAMQRFASVANHLRLASDELASIYDDLAQFFPQDAGGIGMFVGQSMRQVISIDEIRDEVDEISMRLALDDESQRNEGGFGGGDGDEGSYLERKASEERTKIAAEEEARKDREDWERLVDSQYREQARYELRRIQANAFSIKRMRLDIDETIVGGKSLRWWLKMGLI